MDSHRPFICSVASLLLSLFVIFLLFLLMLSTLLLPMVIAAVEALESMLLLVSLLFLAFLLLLLNLLLPIHFLIFNTKIVGTGRSALTHLLKRCNTQTRRFALLLSLAGLAHLYIIASRQDLRYTEKKSVKNNCSGKKSANHESSVPWTNTVDRQSCNVSAYLTPSQVTNNLNLDTLDPLVQ